MAMGQSLRDHSRELVGAAVLAGDWRRLVQIVPLPADPTAEAPPDRDAEPPAPAAAASSVAPPIADPGPADWAWAWHHLALALEQLNRPADAALVYRNICKLWPQDPSGWKGVARMAGPCGDWPEAVRAWTEVIARFPDAMAIDWLQALAWAQIETGAHDAALTTFARIRQLWPGDPQAWTDAAHLHARRGDWPAAAAAWQAAIEAFPFRAAPDWWQSLVWARAEAGQFAAALTACRRQITRWPDAISGWTSAAQIAARTGDWPGAARAWQAAIAAFPDAAGPDWWQNLAWAQAESGDAAAALHSYLTLAERWPDLDLGWFGAASIAAQHGDWAQSVAAWQGAIAACPGRMTLETWQSLAWAQVEMGDPSAALATCRHMQTLWPDHPEGWKGAAQMAARQGNWPLAVDAWQTCLDRFADRSEPGWWMEMVWALRALGRESEAEDALHRICALFPQDPTGWIGLAQAAEAARRPARAEQAWRLCLSRFADQAQPEWHVGLARSLIRQNRLRPAHAVLDTAEGLWPDHLALRLVRADALLLQYGWARAARHLLPPGQPADAASYAAADPGALQQIARALIFSGRWAEAQLLIGRLRAAQPDGSAWLRLTIDALRAQGDARGARVALADLAGQPGFAAALPPDLIAAILHEAGVPKSQALDSLCAYLPEDEARLQFDALYRLEVASRSRKGPATRPIAELDPPRRLRELLRALARERIHARFESLVDELAPRLDLARLQRLAAMARHRFPRSRSRLRLDALIQGRTIPATRSDAAFLHRWQNVLPAPAQALGPALARLPWRRLRCALVVRDEDELLPRFLAHHHALGVTSFVVIDNGSARPVRDSLSGIDSTLPGIEIDHIRSDVPFVQVNHGMAWMNEILGAGICDWLLFLDGDEFLHYPGAPDLRLPDLLDHMQQRGEDALAALMVDLHDVSYRQGGLPSDRIADHDGFTAGQGLTRAVAQDQLSQSVPEPGLPPRWQIFYHHQPLAGIVSTNPNKMPLVRATAGVRYLDNHTVTTCRVSTTLAVLQHLKLFRDRELLAMDPARIAAHPRVRERAISCVDRHMRMSGAAGSLAATTPSPEPLAQPPKDSGDDALVTRPADAQAQADEPDAPPAATLVAASGAAPLDHPFHLPFTESCLFRLGYLQADPVWRARIGRSLPADRVAPALALAPQLPVTLGLGFPWMVQPLHRVLGLLADLARSANRPALRTALRAQTARSARPELALALALQAALALGQPKTVSRLHRLLLRQINKGPAQICIPVLCDLALALAEPPSPTVPSRPDLALAIIQSALDACGRDPRLLACRFQLMLHQGDHAAAKRDRPHVRPTPGTPLHDALMTHLDAARSWQDFTDQLARLIDDGAQPVTTRLLLRINAIPFDDMRQSFRQRLLDRCESDAAHAPPRGEAASVRLALWHLAGRSDRLADLWPDLDPVLPPLSRRYFRRLAELRAGQPGYNKAWCLGLSKTGTTSLHVFAQRLGLLSAHWVNPVLGRLITAEDAQVFDLVSDTSAVFLARQGHLPPGQPIILTRRSAGTWVPSLLSHFQRYLDVDPSQPFSRFQAALHAGLPIRFGAEWTAIHDTLYYCHADPLAALQDHHAWIDRLIQAGHPILDLPLELPDHQKATLVSDFLGMSGVIRPYPHSNRAR